MKLKNLSEEEIKEKLIKALFKKKFADYLRKYTILKESSIRQYATILGSHIFEIEEAIKNKDVDALNEIIIKEYRYKNSNAIKFALVHYLKMKKKYSMVFQLTKLKRKPKKKVHNWLNSWEIEKLIKSLPNPEKIIVQIQFETGGRIREILQITRDLIQDKDGIYYVFLRTKTNQFRRCRISKESYETLIKYIDGLSEDEYFIFLHKQPKNNEELEKIIRVRYSMMFRVFKETAKKVLKKEVGTHDIRRSLAEWIIRKDPSLNGIRKAQIYLGHRDSRTTFQYFKDAGLIDEIEMEDVFKDILNSVNLYKKT